MIEAKHVPQHRKMTVDEMMAFCFKSLSKQFKSGLWWLLGLLLMAALNVAAVVVIISIYDKNSTIPLIAFLDSGSMPEMGLPFISGLILAILIFALDFLYGLFATAYIFRVGLDAGYNTERNIRERLSLAYKEGWSLAGVGGLYILTVGLITIVSVVLSLMATFSVELWLLSIQIVFNFVSSFLLYYFSVKLSCWIPLIIEEGYTTFEAVSLSFKMTKGRGWRIFGYQILIGLIAGIGAIMFMLVVGGAGVGLIIAELNAFVTILGGVLVILAYFAVLTIVILVDVNLSVGIYNALDREHTEELAQEPVIQRESETRPHEVAERQEEQVQQEEQEKQGPKDPIE